ncbi:radical SAM protein [Methanolobus halotolerans]|uniref:Radical SAM protein n=1 Tax=Methanolobus halotolerans TaxID=2052935 RepID=A0A4E0PYA6_9EURY|nr:radical SAM protein [Methanolobus halotolerans]TGC09859.1 radical SAM protein [Methanolobus halotolerans]
MQPETKARLISAGSVDMDPELVTWLTVPTAGPGAGNMAFFFCSEGHRVRLAIKKDSPLKAWMEGGQLVITKDGMELARGSIEPELIHCPDQAFITMCEKCIFDCKFCPVPKLSGKVKTTDEMLGMIERARVTGKMHAISITSGVEISAEAEVSRAEELIKRLREIYSVPIGVSVYPTENSTRRLKSAGADELKYNVETMDRELHEKLCPDQDLEFILGSLKQGVSIFGRNRVCSNFIIGLGESDESAKRGIEELTSIGVVPILRAAAKHPLREKDVTVERPSAKRLLMLNRFLREKLDEYGLRADTFKTMCLPCTGCDINPHSDLE